MIMLPPCCTVRMRCFPLQTYHCVSFEVFFFLLPFYIIFTQWFSYSGHRKLSVTHFLALSGLRIKFTPKEQEQGSWNFSICSLSNFELKDTRVFEKHLCNASVIKAQFTPVKPAKIILYIQVKKTQAANLISLTGAAFGKVFSTDVNLLCPT